MPTKGKKGKEKSKRSKDEHEVNDHDSIFNDPQPSKLVLRMASRTLNTGAKKLADRQDHVNSRSSSGGTSQSSLWLSKTKVYRGVFV